MIFLIFFKIFIKTANHIEDILIENITGGELPLRTCITSNLFMNYWDIELA